MGTLLSDMERQELLVRHYTERDKRVADRIKAVIWRDEGMTYSQIAALLFLSDEGVRQHLKDYENAAKLAPANGGSQPKLDKHKTADLLAHLDDHLYVKAADICAVVRKTYGIFYSESGMKGWLARNGFTFHQPCGTPAKADAKAQQAFVTKYENIKKNLDEGDQIVFMDGVHPSHAVRFVRGWIRKGVRREIPTNASQKRVNIIGALNLESMTLTRQEHPTLNADAVIAFLTLLLSQQTKGLLHIILDRGRYQYCKAVWEFVDANPRLRLHYLPPYSPNLNAIEPAWKLMHEHTTNNQYHAHFKDFTEAIRTFFDVTFPKKSRQWTDQLTDNFRVMQSPLLANS